MKFKNLLLKPLLLTMLSGLFFTSCDGDTVNAEQIVSLENTKWRSLGFVNVAENGRFDETLFYQDVFAKPFAELEATDHIILNLGLDPSVNPGNVYLHFPSIEQENPTVILNANNSNNSNAECTLKEFSVIDNSQNNDVFINNVNLGIEFSGPLYSNTPESYFRQLVDPNQPNLLIIEYKPFGGIIPSVIFFERFDGDLPCPPDSPLQDLENISGVYNVEISIEGQTTASDGVLNITHDPTIATITGNYTALNEDQIETTYSFTATNFNEITKGLGITAEDSFTAMTFVGIYSSNGGAITITGLNGDESVTQDGAAFGNFTATKQ
jgi:hypothetical protein